MCREVVRAAAAMASEKMASCLAHSEHCPAAAACLCVASAMQFESDYMQLSGWL